MKGFYDLKTKGLTVAVILLFLVTGAFVRAQEEIATQAQEAIATTETTVTLSAAAEVRPAGFQEVSLQTPADLKGWQADGLLTFGFKFLLRGREAYRWAAQITDSGADSPALEAAYQKVLSVVNGLFLLGLLLVAGLWLFKVLLPRAQLRSTMAAYAFAVLLVNFALPFNRLLIDGSTLLQRTLLPGGEKEAILAQITMDGGEADYEKAVGYSTAPEADPTATEKKSSIMLRTAGTDPTTPLVTVESGFIGGPSLQLSGTLSGTSGGDINVQGFETSRHFRVAQPLEVTVQTEKPFAAQAERAVFASILVFLMGTAYLSFALVFILRLIILWAMLIASPVFLVLAIFRFTRGYFLQWLAVYGRWLLLGPFMALGLSAVGGLFSFTGLSGGQAGLPLSSAYGPGLNFGTATNVSLLLPGQTTPLHFANTAEMMLALVYVLLLFLPLVLAFALTRQKHLTGAFAAITEFVPRAKTVPVKIEAPEKRMPEVRPIQEMFSTVTHFVGGQVGKFAEAAMPSKTPDTIMGRTTPIPSAASFLPEPLALTPPHQLLSLVGARPESRHSREQALEKLSAPEKITEIRERQQVEAVRHEIESRAERGQPEAVVLMAEIQSKTQDVPASEPGRRAAETAPAETKESAMGRPQEVKNIENPDGVKENETDPSSKFHE